jgi:ABC-type transport system involved in cytochrome bd biosynthesis fused ATPase/permease subunit
MILKNLSSKGKFFWFGSFLVGILASVLEVASAAAFSLLTSVLFGGRNSNLGVLANVLPIAITETVLTFTLGFVFLGKLACQWIELNLKTKSAEEFYASIFIKKAQLSQKSIEISQAPATNIASRMHILTHNIYYPAGLIISELMIMVLLVPFVIFISPKASLLVFGTTILLSVPILTLARKQMIQLSQIRTQIDTTTDFENYIDYRVYYDQGLVRRKSTKLSQQIHLASEIDRKIVKLGSYSRLAIELSFIVSVILTFIFIEKLVPAESRIQFFAVLGYSFFRVIPAFTRIVGARNQLASHQSEFIELAAVMVSSDTKDLPNQKTTFEESLAIKILGDSTFKFEYEFNFRAGEIVLVRGETGVGKTTLLKVIGGLRSGQFEITLDGKVLSDSDVWQPAVALVSQNPFLYGRDLKEIISGQQSIRIEDSELYAKSLRISGLEAWNVTRTGEITNENISGGERKQIALARAIFLNPEILLLDEITAGMDYKLSEKIIANICASNEFKLIVLTSHDPLNPELFDRVIDLL